MHIRCIFNRLRISGTYSSPAIYIYMVSVVYARLRSAQRIIGPPNEASHGTARRFQIMCARELSMADVCRRVTWRFVTRWVWGLSFGLAANHRQMPDVGMHSSAKPSESFAERPMPPTEMRYYDSPLVNKEPGARFARHVTGGCHVHSQTLFRAFPMHPIARIRLADPSHRHDGASPLRPRARLQRQDVQRGAGACH